MTILVLTTDPLPLPGLTATGAGLRAWSLAQGLRSAGFDARACMPASLLDGRADPATPPYSHHTYPGEALGDFIARARPDVIVAQHWGMAARLPDVAVPLALDLAGPHLLERRHWGRADLAADIGEKIAALARADFVLCSGRDQRLYFLPWLIMAGFDPADPALCPAIPFSWSPDPPPPRRQPPGRGEEIRFFAGGVLLPWQDLRPGIEALLEAMDAAGQGRLIFHGGPHPALNVAGGESQGLLDLLERHPRAEPGGLLPFDAFLKELSRADAAFDLLPRNNERELAFPIRTVMALWAGLPVIHADYDEPGRWIAESGAGWVLDPDDSAAIRRTIGEILADPSELATRGAAAQRLAGERLNWANTIGPLARFCREPQRRDKKAPGIGAPAETMRTAALEGRLADAHAEIGALRGAWPMRWARRLKRMAWIAAPLIALGVFAALAVVAVAALLSDLVPVRSTKRPRNPAP